MNAKRIDLEKCLDCGDYYEGIHWCKFARSPTNVDIMKELAEIKRMVWLLNPSLEKIVEHINESAKFYDNASANSQN